MKHLYNILFCLLLTTAYFSCAPHQEGVPQGIVSVGEDSEIAVDISRKRTRAFTLEERLDDTIQSLRILMFDTIAGSHKCVYNFRFGKLSYEKIVRFNVAPETTYDLVVVANEHKDPDVSAALEAFDETRKLEEVHDIWFKASAFLDTEEIPMSIIYKKLKVLSNRRWVNRKNGGEDTVTYPIPIEVERLGVRLSVNLKTESIDKQAKLAGIRLDNIPEKVPLFPVDKNGVLIDNTTGSNSSHRILGNGVDPEELGIPWRTVNEDTDGDNVDETFYILEKGRTIIPSIVFNDPTSRQGIDLVLEYAGMRNEGVMLGIDTPDDYTIPRNVWLTLSAVMEDDDIVFENITVNEWGSRNDIELGD
ncbi:hypothetical protein [Bacteroides sp. 224]|uniref:hypothetical protein n=1 Tax=Bacteroides sp. 224 TaxID=2302936 RepID=UPI0013D5C654|nr:hypothetical protein [Bacteroides sp. 224]NDV66569.1 hypothetical protein [Bacteroides sp. 224]